MTVVSLAEVATITSGKRPQEVEKTWSARLNVPVIGGGGPSGFTNSTLFHGNVLITGRVGTLGKLFAPDVPCWPSDNALVIIPKDARTDFQFLRYALQMTISDVTRMNRGAANPLITQKDLGSLKLNHPSLPQQRAIANILSALDDKIELNRRMNETLEGMAQAIFKDWFVNFGPTRRKLVGVTDPVAIMGGLTPDAARATELAALFPDALQDDGLPMGWRLGRVEEILELSYGKSLPKTERADGPYPVYGSGGVTGTHISALVKGPGIIVGRKGTVGSLYWENSDFFPIDTVFYVKPEAGFSLEQIWFLLGSLGLEHMNTDAAVPGLNRNNVYRLEIPIAPGIINNEFCKFAAPLIAKAQSNRTESRTLAETRDYLLPKLMSGEVRVRDAVTLAEGSPA